MTSATPIDPDLLPDPLSQQSALWRARLRTVASRPIGMRIDHAWLEASWSPRGYRLVLEGEGLSSTWSPPSLTVGTEAAQRLQFEPSGHRIMAFLRAIPSSRKVTIDYGFASATAELERRARWLIWWRWLLLSLWDWLDGHMRRWLGPRPG